MSSDISDDIIRIRNAANTISLLKLRLGDLIIIKISAIASNSICHPELTLKPQIC